MSTDFTVTLCERAFLTHIPRGCGDTYMRTQVEPLAEFLARDKHVGNFLKGARPKGISILGAQGRENGAENLGLTL